MERTKLEMAWAEFVLGLCCTVPTAYVQIRKMFNEQVWELPYEVFEPGLEIEAERLQYASWKSKFAQLDRNYWNQEEFDLLRTKFLERVKKEQTCLTARFGNKEKDSRSMGFCMQTISLNYLRKPVEGQPKFVVELYYRSTEVGQKFLADLAYLSDKVLPFLLQDLPIKPDIIRFRFCTMYMSSMFLPILFQTIHPVEVVKAIKEGDEHWYNRTVSQSLGRWLQEDNPYNWRTQAKQWDNFNENVKPQLTASELRNLKRLARKEK